MSRPTSRSASRPPSRSGLRDAPGPSRYQDLEVNLKDCENLIRHRIVGLPGNERNPLLNKAEQIFYHKIGGLTKSGNPLVVFPNNYKFNEVLESDLHLLLKYIVSVIPQDKQVIYKKKC